MALSWLFALLLIPTSAYDSLIEDKQDAVGVYTSQPTLNFSLLQGESLELKFHNVTTNIGKPTILLRKEPFEGDMAKDYVKNSWMYKETNICRHSPARPHIDLNEKALVKNQSIQSVVVDRYNMRLFYVDQEPGLYSVGLTLEDRLLKIQGYPTKLLSLSGYKNSYELKFLQQYKILYLFSNLGLHAVNTQAQNYFLTPVKGYEEKAVEPKDIHLGGLTFSIVVRNGTESAVNVYFLTDDYSVNKIQTVSKFNGTSLGVADVYMVGSQLWVLDFDFGIYVYSYSEKGYVENRAIKIRYGKKVLLRRQAKTFEIIFEVTRRNYIAYLYLNEKYQLVLNRFYNQLEGVRYVNFAHYLILAVGDNECMAVEHSMNSMLVDRSWWQPKIYHPLANFIKIFKVTEPENEEVSNMTYMMDYFIVTKPERLIALTLSRKPLSISCEYGEQYTLPLLIEYNTTISNLNYLAHPSKYYTTRVPLVLNFQSKPYGKKTSMLITYGSAFLILAAIISIVVLTHIYRTKKNQEYRALKDQLQQRITELELNQMPKSREI